MALLVMPVGAVAQVVHTYEDVPAAPITTGNNNCPSGGTSITRTINVSDSFNVGAVGTIALGVEINHATRDHLQIRLTAPNGNTIVLANGAAADANDNYSVTFADPNTGLSSTNDAGPLNDGTDDFLAVAAGAFYRRLVNITNMSSTLYPVAASANGNWTLRICDDTAGTAGTYVRARLTLRNNAITSQAVQCGSTSTFDWGTVVTTPVRGTGSGQVWADGTFFTAGNVRITQTLSDGAPSDSLPSFFRVTTQTGNHTGYYRLEMDTTGNTELSAESVLFTFDQPVSGLNFAMLDVDWALNSWEDYVQVIATGPSGNPVPYLSTFDSGTNLARVGDWTEADVSASATQTIGNQRYRFMGAVSNVRIVYAQGDEPAADSTQQFVGIEDFSFCAFDYGDAPSPYPVTVAQGGPRHVLGNRTVFIGLAPDGESDGAQSTNADSDQATNGDESPAQSLPSGIPAYLPQGGQVCDAGGGITYTTPQPGPTPGAPGQYCLVVAATNNSASAATMVGWIDFNNDGDFADAGERSRAQLGGGPAATFGGGNIGASSTGNRILVWDNVQIPSPGTLTLAAKVLRLRISTDATALTGLRIADPQPNTLATDGEIEDHILPANTLPVTLAYVDVQRADAGALLVRWTTATEAGARGFRVLQQQSDRQIAAISERLVPSALMTSTRPSDYEAWVSTTTDGPIYIEEVSVGGKVERFGPYYVGSSTGKRPQLVAAPWEQARAESRAHESTDDATRLTRASTQGLEPAAEVLVSKTGLQRVLVSDLSAAGVDFVGRLASELRLRHGDTVVPFRVAGGDATLSSSSVLEFWGDAVDGSLYTSTRPYLLELAAGGLAWTVEDGTPQVGPVATKWSTERSLGADRYYSVTATNGDPWYFDMVERNGPPLAGKQWTLDLPGADASKAGRVSVELWGGVGIPELPVDHRYRISINGTAVGEGSFDGVMPHEQSFDVAAGVLQAGANLVRLDLIDTGDTFDRVFVERITVSHTASLSATAGQVDVPQGAFVGVPEQLFAGAFEDVEAAPLACGVGCEQIEVRGFSSPDIVALRMSPVGPVELSGVVATPVAGGYAARVRSAAHGVLATGDGGPEAGRLVLVERSRAQVPALRPALALAHPLTGGAAELLVISSARFAGSVDELVSARQAEGLSVRVVTVDQVYAAYNGGIVDPESIRQFVGEARQQLGTRYVLLVGGDTYDYFDHLGLGSVSDVPTLYRKTHEYVSFAPVDSAFGDADGDGRPEVAIGRLPARTASELTALLTKVLSPLPANPWSSVFVAERANLAEGINYSVELDELIADLSPTWQGGVGRVYLDSFPNTAAARSELLSQVNTGRNWVSYYGHASPATWSRETLLDANDLPGQLNNAGRWPVVSEFGCWGGYFVEPTYSTLAHSWLLTADRGARAMLASASLTESSSDRAIAQALVPQMATPGIRLGDALLNAQTEVHARSPERADVTIGMTLLGDPSARLTPQN
jgi:subtilisin-like proprotein convertase family protein